MHARAVKVTNRRRGMAKLKKGDALVCIPCGREVAVSSAGISTATIWCCGMPMKAQGTGGSRRAREKKQAARK
jgi:hypothetical protein